MQVLAKLSTPVYPPNTDQDFVTKQYVDEKVEQVTPIVNRVRFRSGPDNPQGPPAYHSQGFNTEYYQVYLQLNFPAPANCWVAFYRARGTAATGTINTPRRDISMGFRALGWTPDTLFSKPSGQYPQWGDPGNSADMPAIQITPGATEVILGPVRRLFRPVLHHWQHKNYSRYYREVPPALWNPEMPTHMRWATPRRDVKIILKFGTALRYRDPGTNFWIERRGPMSNETMKIMRWRYNESYNSHVPTGTAATWGLKVEMY